MQSAFVLHDTAGSRLHVPGTSTQPKGGGSAAMTVPQLRSAVVLPNSSKSISRKVSFRGPLPRSTTAERLPVCAAKWIALPAIQVCGDALALQVPRPRTTQSASSQQPTEASPLQLASPYSGSTA